VEFGRKLVQWQLVRNALLWLLRVYAYGFHLVLALFLIGISTVALTSGTNLTLGMLPWQGATLTSATLLLGLVGVVCIIMAVTGFVRWLFPLWALIALILMLRGFFLSSYTFPSAGDFRSAVWLSIAAFVAFVGSLSLFGRRRARH
jgi:hypothetical protein